MVSEADSEFWNMFTFASRRQLTVLNIHVCLKLNLFFAMVSDYCAITLYVCRRCLDSTKELSISESAAKKFL